MRVVFDLETNGLLDRPDLRIHCGVVADLDSDAEWRYGPEEIEAMLAKLGEAELLIGHAVATFDVPVLERLYPQWTHTDQLYDTKAVGAAMYASNILEWSIACRNAAGPRPEDMEAAYPKSLLHVTKIHKLEAWGYRLGYHKGDFLKEQGVQEEFSEALLSYCARDVRLTKKLALYLMGRPARESWPQPALEAMIVESRAAYILGFQERNGVGFDHQKAQALHVILKARRDELLVCLRSDYFPDWVGPTDLSYHWKNSGAPPTETPARTYTTEPARDEDGNYKPSHVRGKEAGCPYTPVALHQFEPTPFKIADRLYRIYGWAPKHFTPKTGLPIVSEEVLSDLDYPAVPVLVELLTVEKRIGQLAEGKEAWLRHVRADGLIHGRVAPTGARTGRMAHSSPNLAQVPTVASPWGRECRELFRPTRTEWVMVGVDAERIELAALAHRLAAHDEGAFAQVLAGGDTHEEWRRITGLFDREQQKRISYALIYGAGDEKLGLIAIEDHRRALAAGKTDKPAPALNQAKRIGSRIREALVTRVAGFERFLAQCEAAHRRGYIRAIDGRVNGTGPRHAVPNDVLQSDAALIMKHALVTFDDRAAKRGFQRGVDFAYLLNVHDEWQIETPPIFADEIGKLACESISSAAAALKFRLPLGAKYKVGRTWSETH